MTSYFLSGRGSRKSFELLILLSRVYSFFRQPCDSHARFGVVDESGASTLRMGPFWTVLVFMSEEVTIFFASLLPPPHPFRFYLSSTLPSTGGASSLAIPQIFPPYLRTLGPGSIRDFNRPRDGTRIPR